VWGACVWGLSGAPHEPGRKSWQSLTLRPTQEDVAFMAVQGLCEAGHKHPLPCGPMAEEYEGEPRRKAAMSLEKHDLTRTSLLADDRRRIW